MTRATEARALVERLLRADPDHALAVRLWDGAEVGPAAPRATLVLADPEVLDVLLGSRDPAHLADAYVAGRLDVEGDPDAAIAALDWLPDADLGLSDKLRIAWRTARTSGHSRRDDRRDVRAHYDLADGFFALFLDEERVYSAATFGTPDEGLEAAQRRKLDRICAKLDLKPGMRLLDVGCGWGALVVRAALDRGVEATGITLSQNQAAAARRRIEALGLHDRVTILEADYRALPKDVFDAIASIGMYEHVGVDHLPGYFQALHQALKPGGRLLNQGITVPRGSAAHIGGEWILDAVFPGAELTDLGTVVQAMEDAGFEVEDVEDLRRHYARTLRHWTARYRAHRAEAARLVDDRVLRTFDLYLPGCARAFEIGEVGCHQVVCTRRADARADRDPHLRTL